MRVFARWAKSLPTPIRMVRYADDFVILCERAEQAQKALAEVRAWVEENGLTLHPDKTHIMVRGWYGYFKHADQWIFPSLDGFIRRRLRVILRKQEKRLGMGKCYADHKSWPNTYFAALGLFTMTEARMSAGQPR